MGGIITDEEGGVLFLEKDCWIVVWCFGGGDGRVSVFIATILGSKGVLITLLFTLDCVGISCSSTIFSTLDCAGVILVDSKGDGCCIDELKIPANFSNTRGQGSPNINVGEADVGCFKA